MSDIQTCELPESAILHRYSRSSLAGGGHQYTDCYSVRVDRAVALAEFVHAFYTTPLFRLERLILGLIGRPSTDEQARQLSQGLCDIFAAWTVEQRAENQLLMCDFRKRTRSWFMVDTAGNDSDPTLLYFGSAVVPVVRDERGDTELGLAFTLLLGFHKLYSKALLAAASRRLVRGTAALK